MMKYIWAVMIAASTVYGIAAGKGEALSAAVIGGAADGAETAMALLGSYCLWLGLMNVAKDGGIAARLAHLMKKPLGALMKGIKHDEAAMTAVSMNIAANALGMGNAATPFGIMAMKEMKRASGEKELPTDEMCMFLVINTASVQLIPMTVIGLRSAAGSASAADILLPALLATAATAVFAVLLAKVCAALSKKA